MPADRLHAPGLHAYRADHAFDGTRMLPGGALVLVSGTTIVGVEPVSAAVPDGCPVTHLPGTTLLPGLVETHTHLCGDSGPRALEQLPELTDDDLDAIVRRSLAEQLAAGVTAVRDLGDAHWTVVDRHRHHPDGPTVVASGPPVTVTAGHCWNMGGEADGPQALLAAVRERAARGADVVKVMASGGMITATTDVTKPQYPLDDLRLVVGAAHAAGLPVTAHAHAVAAVELCLRAGVDGIEHCTCVGGDRPGMHAPPDLVARLAASGVVVCPTQGHVPGSTYPPSIRAVMDRTGITPEGIVDHVRTLVEGGVRLVAGSDSGIYPDKRHGVLPWALVELVGAGASPVAALAAGTAHAADAIGLGARTGRLRAGLDADLLLVDGDAGTDVTAVTRVRTVVSRGRVVRGPGPP